jgi:hypothetical protein
LINADREQITFEFGDVGDDVVVGEAGLVRQRDVFQNFERDRIEARRSARPRPTSRQRLQPVARKRLPLGADQRPYGL